MHTNICIYKYTFFKIFYFKDNPIKNWVRNLNSHFRKDNHTANKHMKRCSESLVVREMQIKIIIWYHSTSTTWLLKNYKNIYLWLSSWSSQNFHKLMTRVYIAMTPAVSSLGKYISAHIRMFITVFFFAFSFFKNLF